MTEEATAPMRSDARARRAALITAAAECFAESGYGVPLEEVAARAGVGRGTLYRNFRDREAMALAIFDRELDRMGEIAASAGPLHDTLHALVEGGAGTTALFARIGSDLVATASNRAALERLGERFADMLQPLADRAQAAGELREGIDGRRLGMALRMASAVFAPHKATGARADLAEVLDLLLHGIAPAQADRLS